VGTANISPVELYDLESDPQEKNNIAARHPDIVKRAEAIMKEAYTPNKSWPLFFEEK
jgi:arylsulfatase A